MKDWINNIKEGFARVRIDTGGINLKPRQAPQSAEWVAGAASVPAPTASYPSLYPTLPDTIEMASADKIMQTLGIGTYHDEKGQIEKAALLHASCRLSRQGVTMVPDSRCPFRVKATDRIALMRISETAPHITYRSVTLTVAYLAVWLIQNDNPTEADINLIDKWIVNETPKHRNPLPLQGMVRWLMSRKRILSQRVKKRVISQMGRFVNKRAKALQLLTSLTAGKGILSAKRLDNLQKLLPLFGINPHEVHSTLHRFATTGSATAKAAPGSTARIDTAKIRAMETDTRRAQQLLGEIFADEENQFSPQDDNSTCSEDSPLTMLIHRLATKEVWTADEYEALCRELNLRPTAALEEINDLAYETADEAFAEDDGDSIIIDPAIAAVLTNETSSCQR